MGIKGMKWIRRKGTNDTTEVAKHEVAIRLDHQYAIYTRRYAMSKLLDQQTKVYRIIYADCPGQFDTNTAEYSTF